MVRGDNFIQVSDEPHKVTILLNAALVAKKSELPQQRCDPIAINSLRDKDGYSNLTL